MIKSDIPRLTPKAAAEKKLDPANTPPAIRAKTGLSDPSGGIASPLTESAYADRVFYPTSTILSSDGVFVFEIKALQTLKMTDAKGKEVMLAFAEKI